MKKWLSVLLVLLMLVSLLSACGNDPLPGSGIEVEDDGEDEGVKGGSPDTKPDVTPETNLCYGIYIEGIVSYELDEKGRLVGLRMVSELLDDEPFGTISDENGGFAAGFEYGADGRLTALLEDSGKDEIIYDNDGNAFLDEGTEPIPLTLTYHANGSIKEYGTKTSSMESMIRFNEQGKMTSYGSRYMRDGSEVQYEYIITYEGNKETVTCELNGEKMDGSLVLIKDEKGRPLSYAEYDGDEQQMIRWTWKNDRVTGYAAYNVEADGAETKVMEVKLTFDENGNRTKKENFREDVLREYFAYTYDEDGRMLTETKYDEDGTVLGEATYAYDEEGNLIPQRDPEP